MKKLQFFEAVQFAQKVIERSERRRNHPGNRDTFEENLGKCLERVCANIYQERIWFPMMHSDIKDCFHYPEAIDLWLEAIIEEEWVEDIKLKLYSYEQGRSAPAA